MRKYFTLIALPLLSAPTGCATSARTVTVTPAEGVPTTAVAALPPPVHASTAAPQAPPPPVPAAPSALAAPAAHGSHGSHGSHGAAPAGGHGAHWTYSGDHGPAFWGKLGGDYALCSAGRQQSPIDITGAFSNAAMEALQPAFQPGGSKALNNGHTLQLNFEPGSSLRWGGRNFTLAQYHVHAPSEHRLNGVSYPMEIHFVHKSGDGKLAVVGLLLEQGAGNPLVEQLLQKAPQQPGEVALTSPVSVADVWPTDARYFTYEGSLTTPPCTEGVRWLVLKQPGSVSREQVERFLQRIDMNSRPVQALHGRLVENPVASLQ